MRTTTPGRTAIPEPPRAGARFWALIALFALLIVGTVDVAARLWSGDLDLCDERCASGPLDALGWLVWFVSMNGLFLVAGALTYWLVRCLVGWWRARAGDDATVASHGGAGWLLAIVMLAVPNVGAAALLVLDALHASEAAVRAESWLSVATMASNLWVLAYYSVRRRWDGRRVSTAG